MERILEPELLDRLPAVDPDAIRSRRDLRRLNFFMRNAGTIAQVLSENFGSRSPRRIVDLGAGDGTLMLRVARRLSSRWRDVEVVLVDQQDIVNERTHMEFKALSWRSKSVQSDVVDWLSDQSEPTFDFLVANLFLHHFPEPTLRRMFELAAGRTGGLAACEPRRNGAAIRVCHCLWLLGCNRVTCHDALASVRAGFNGKELSGLWPMDGSWRIEEGAKSLFSHCFVAKRKEA